MSVKIIIYFVAALISLSLIYILINQTDSSQSQEYISVASAMSSENDSLYEHSVVPIAFDFPKDYGSHNKFKLEWWYFTGNVMGKNGEKFGYQFTIFRNALRPDSASLESSFAANQMYFAHFGLTDISNGKHYYFEKFARGSEGLAGAEIEPLNVYIENWNIKAIYPQGDVLQANFTISAESEDVSINLKLVPDKKMVLHGDRGLSQKSNKVGNASYYYSFTRLNTEGSITLKNKYSEVKGLSWMDREWSTSALAANQVGWDWFSIQLSDNSELMLFQLRDDSGASDFSKGTYVHPDGKYENIAESDIKLEILEQNKLPSGTTYPSKWSIEIPRYKIKLVCQVQVPDQEMKLSVKYYEGSIEVSGSKNEIEFEGSGYVELTGYENKKL